LAARLHSRDAASDVLQAAFLRLVKSRKKLRGVENPIAYLFQVARNEANRWAKQQQAIERPLEIADEYAANISGTQSDDREVITKALARLSNEDCEIVELKLFAGLTFREIAEVVGAPQATVATRYRRALESLRPWVEKQLQ
jgi:RNA polymerase sigma-70 factor (ECF subfamily)